MFINNFVLWNKNWAQNVYRDMKLFLNKYISKCKEGDSTMTSFITPNVRRLGRAFLALSLAILALVLVLSAWGRIPTAEASEPAVAEPGSTEHRLSSSSILTYYVFLPILFKSDVVYYDDFSNSSSGWPHEVSFEDCYYEYKGGTYRVKVTGNNQRCIIPHKSIPKQVNGTFRVRVRRTSDDERPLLYGLIFGAGVDATRNRWAVEMYPNNDSSCGSQPFYWLYALVGGDRKLLRTKCTSHIDTGEDRWNDLKIIRNGGNIKVYINGEAKGEYNETNYLPDQGYTLMEVISASNQEVTVEFDDFEIRSSTSP